MEKRLLAVIDMQNDFIDGSMGTKEAAAILPNVVGKIREYQKNEDDILFTMDTHFDHYLDTQEGKHLPVIHCVKGTDGWKINSEIQKALDEKQAVVIDKPTFGSVELGEYVRKLDREEPVEEILLIGVCTDICVISNALLAKAFSPETRICVRADCCAGVTPASHGNALAAMRACQIEIV